MGEFELPSEISRVTGQNPRDLCIISSPKMGKSSILGSLTTEKNGLIIDLERNGYEYIQARKLCIYDKDDTSVLQAYHNYIIIRNLLYSSKGKYDYLIIDGLSDLDMLSEIGGTESYMKTTIGKSFNRDKTTGNAYKYGDPEYRLVNTLPEGAGFYHQRKWFLDQIDLFREIAPYRIYAAHMSDKMIKENGREEVLGSELALTGKLKTIFASKVTSLAKLVADGEKRYLSFDVANDSILAGSRAPFLNGKILISEKQKNGIKTSWENIYK